MDTFVRKLPRQESAVREDTPAAEVYRENLEGKSKISRLLFNRASMTQERLSSLALMHIHYLTDIDLDIVVDLFAKMHPRRLELGTLLKDRDDQQPAE